MALVSESAIGEVVRKVLADTGVPSASVAVCFEGAVSAWAFGNARWEPVVPATPEMRYKIASNGKQITAAAVLLLAEEGRLSLDAAVACYFPELTRAGEITIRQLLAHTSGYQDYYPLDYLTPWMARDTTADEILNRWARKPLDFEPGSKFSYSNSGYVLLGYLIEKLSGQSYEKFLQDNIFTPLEMKDSGYDSNSEVIARRASGYAPGAVGLW